MSVPAIVQSRLDGEQVAAEVPLGGEDALFVTRTRTLVYRADGLLSDESVEEYPHEAERIAISEGRRKSSIELDYGIDGTETFKLPSNRLYEALHPVLAGVLNAAGVTGPDETVMQTYQFSELTLVITSERVVKHVGSAVWDEDYEEFHFDDVTALEVEEGSVSSQIIVEDGGRPQRIKTPSDQTREVRERIEQALLDYHDARSYDEFARERADDSDPDDDAETTSENDPLAGSGVTPIDADPPELDDDGEIVADDAESDDVPTAEASESSRAGGASDAATASASTDSAEADDPFSTDVDSRSGAPEQTDATEPTTETTDQTADHREAGSVQGGESPRQATQADESGQTHATTDDSSGGFADSGFQPASSELEDDATEAQLQALTEAVERQNELLLEHQRTLETLVEELKRGR